MNKIQMLIGQILIACGAVLLTAGAFSEVSQWFIVIGITVMAIGMVMQDVIIHDEL